MSKAILVEIAGRRFDLLDRQERHRSSFEND